MTTVKQLRQDQEHGTGKQQPDPYDWITAVLMISRHYRLECSEQNIRQAVHWYTDSEQHNLVRQIARQAGLAVRFGKLTKQDLSPWRLPLVLQLQDGQLVVAQAVKANGDISICPIAEQGLTLSVSYSTLLGTTQQKVTLRPLSGGKDVRIDGYIAPWQRGWLWRLIVPELKPYWHVMLASMIANILALAGILFSMQVYDRVIPAQSMPTLYVLFGGVLLALIFSFLMNLLRSHVTDLLGKRADIRVSDRVFGHALRLRNSVRPKSTGTFISQLRELEQIRELITSSTINALADLPFFLLFMLVFHLIAGPVSWIPLLAVVLMLVLQGLDRPLRTAARASARVPAVSMR
mgnify:CR=1 FL=1